ncbi:MAG TPA: cysteine desulfurase family protein [Polyangiaceae bacterium]
MNGRASSPSPRAVYLDWNATAPPHPDVLSAMARAAESGWANPSSVHAFGRRARAIVEETREEVARLAGRDARDVVFTSGGTEANNLALAGAPAIVTSRVEHPSVVRFAEAAEERGLHVVWLAVDANGLVGPGHIEAALAALPPGSVVAVSAVNHETGVIAPLREIEAVTERAGARLHVDAVQAAGRIPAVLWHFGTSLSIASHKLRGPKAVGALVTRPGHAPSPVLRGGSQERGLRPGTVDAVALAGFRVAAERAARGPERYARLEPERDRMERALFGAAARVNGSGAARAPHVSNLSFHGFRGDELAAALDLEGVSVSSGSACSAGTTEPSPVIQAMLGVERARSALRVSLGEETSTADVDRLLEVLPRLLRRAETRSCAG